jgi:Mu-like prophage major head subunit gpT
MNETPMYAPLGANDLTGYSRVRFERDLPRVAAAAAFWADLKSGRIPAYMLREALSPRTPAIVRAINSNYPGIISLDLSETLTRSDFSNLTSTVLGRMVLARYQEFPSPWRQYCRISTLNDFRAVTRFPVNGLEGPWPEQHEDEELRYGNMSEGTAVTLTPKKYSLGVRLSFELLINDDLNAFDTIPNRLGRGGARTIGRAVTNAYVDANGPHASVYTTGNANKITGNPALSTSSLAAAIGQLRGMLDTQGEPISVEMTVLVVPPSLLVVAQNIIHATLTRMTSIGGASGQEMEVANWIGASMGLAVDPYIPIVASTANGATSWFLFADPAMGNPAIEVGFLSGFETPVIYQHVFDSMRVGGGLDQEAGDFLTMAHEWKGVEAFGVAVIDPKMTVASNGSGT